MDAQTKMQTIIDNSRYDNSFTDGFAPLIEKIKLFLKICYPQQEKKIDADLKRLRIVNTNSINAPIISTNPKTMEIRIRSTKISEEKVDPEYLVAVELLRIFTNPCEDISPIIDGLVSSAVASSHTISNEGEYFHTNEQVITNLLAKVLSDDTVLDLCFNNNRETLNKSLMERNIPVEMFKDFLDKAKYIHDGVNIDNTDTFNKLQASLVDMFSLSPRTKEEMSSLEANLMGPEAREYYLAKKAYAFVTKNEEPEIGKSMVA